MTPPTAHASAPRPRRFLRFMIKAPLGCLAFFLGAAAICILFMPWACGRAVREELVTSFNENYEGELQVGKTWLLSLYGSQWIEDIELRDPEGGLVLEGRARAPRLLSWFFPSDRADPEFWGPVELTIHRIHVQEDAQGITNLARALIPRPDAGWAPAEVRTRGKSLEFRVADNTVGLPNPSRIKLAVDIRRFTWTNRESTARDRELRLENILLDGSIEGGRRGLSVQLSGGGEIPSDTSAATPPGTVTIDYHADRLRSFPGAGDDASWDFRIAAENVCASDLDILLRTDRTLETAFGPWLSEARITTAGGGGEPLRVVELFLRSEVASLTLTDGIVGDDGTITAGDDGLLSIEFPVGGWWTEEALRPFLPLCGALLPINTSDPGRFEMREFTIVDRTGFAANSGRTRIDLPLLKWSLPECLGAELDEVCARPFKAGAVSVSSRLEEGVLHFDRQQLFADNVPIGFDGTYDLVEDVLFLDLAWPVSWPPPPVGGAEGLVEVMGTLCEMKFSVPDR